MPADPAKIRANVDRSPVRYWKLTRGWRTPYPATTFRPSADRTGRFSGWASVATSRRAESRGNTVSASRVSTNTAPRVAAGPVWTANVVSVAPRSRRLNSSILPRLRSRLRRLFPALSTACVEQKPPARRRVLVVQANRGAPPVRSSSESDSVGASAQGEQGEPELRIGVGEVVEFQPLA